MKPHSNRIPNLYSDLEFPLQLRGEAALAFWLLLKTMSKEGKVPPSSKNPSLGTKRKTGGQVISSL